MATFVMFGKYSMEATKAMSAMRTDQAMNLIKQNGGEFKAGYALLGNVDLVLVVDLPNTEAAMKVSAALSKQQGIAFTTAPAVSVADFDKIMG
ncbi:MAG TPA: GYD domain-containing protein [Anaerolineales bacterium]|nr:GYD domain-containing protein [Anaerolineales bacterium]